MITIFDGSSLKIERVTNVREDSHPYRIHLPAGYTSMSAMQMQQLVQELGEDLDAEGTGH